MARYHSFAPERTDINAKWYIDGEDYFSDLADAIEDATAEIFITDWSMNPEVYLRRKGHVHDEESRLDRLLLQKCLEGVDVFVQLWWETETALAGMVNSYHAERHLEALHPRIRVLRHPGGKTKMYWSHHQKIVVIDQKIAFIGGIDLCFGRYDTQKHPLVDDNQLQRTFPGKDYYNPRIVEFTDLHLPFVDLVDRSTVPRMPWHDIHCRFDREAARDVALRKAQHFIYIENQYFIGCNNGVPDAIANRIIRAHKEKTLFRVIILLPITPAGSWETSSVKFVMKWQYDTISRGHHAILPRIMKETGMTEDEVRGYIQFFSLRKCAKMRSRTGDQWVDDQIYIHSKLMIVDDRTVIIGSANINDRSMDGDRDSEIAAVISDNEYVESVMNGRFYLAAKFAFTLRVSLWQEHLGIGEDFRLLDPIHSDTFFDLWCMTANNNARTLRQMFPDAPNDNWLTVSSLKAFQSTGVSGSRPEESEVERSIRGHLITFPLKFMLNERLDADLSIEAVLPSYLFQ